MITSGDREREIRKESEMHPSMQAERTVKALLIKDR